MKWPFDAQRPRVAQIGGAVVGEIVDAQVVAFGRPPTPTLPTVGEEEHGGLALFQVAGAVR